MNVRAIAMAFAGGLVGALIWGAVAALTNYEFGLIAWAIGGLTGGAAVLAGGRGQSVAVACAVIAALSIIGGKLAMSMFLLDGETEKAAVEQLTANFTPSMHADTIQDAREFAAISDPAQHAQFMVSHGYDGGDGLVAPDELENFRKGWAPLLLKWSTRPLAFEEARTEYMDQWKPLVVADIRNEVTHADVLMESFGFMDVVFFLLGVFTAFGIVARRSDQEAAARVQQEQLDRQRQYHAGAAGHGGVDAQALPGTGAPSVQSSPRPRPTTRQVAPGARPRPVVPPGQPRPPQPPRA